MRNTAHGYALIIEALVKAGASIIHTCIYSSTLLHLAGEGNHIRAMQQILELLPEFVAIDTSTASSEDGGPIGALWLEPEAKNIPALIHLTNVDVKKDKDVSKQRFPYQFSREGLVGCLCRVM